MKVGVFRIIRVSLNHGNISKWLETKWLETKCPDCFADFPANKKIYLYKFMTFHELAIKAFYAYILIKGTEES